jgi:CRP-like cAMP-binding protein
MQMVEFRNHVLSILTRDEIALLSPLRPIELHAGDYLLHAGDRVEQAVIPESGVVSLITGIGGGGAIEIAMIGREGLVGSSVVAGNGGATTDLLVQVSGNGYTVPRSRLLHALAQSSRLSRQMSLVDASLFAQAQQSAACNAAHSAQARICRWLLELHDRSDTEVVPLTQSFLARMVGVQRTTVTLVASKLQSAGIIRCRRGKVRVLDPAKLERVACPCYARMRQTRQGLERSSESDKAFDGDVRRIASAPLESADVRSRRAPAAATS